ncbi:MULTISPECIES: hypothetical protein [Pseudomonadota]|uniref:hypothetical protein n=1 Tax=Pseudomonadota TaxID=1224 RepID=UPI0008A2BFC1|nr:MULTISPECIES: hypothetical protein [Pseudomonadota]OFS91308.1 hypothetical protein HMPREF3113_14860 [Stenotrophomonas sp. HMSC10F06]
MDDITFAMQVHLRMPTRRAVFPYLFLLAGGALLLRAMHVLSSPLAGTTGQAAAYADGYAAGQVVAGALLVAAAVSLIALGWRRLRC